MPAPDEPRHVLRRSLTRVKRLGRRPPADPWSAYLDQVEPALGAVPRVHRFAAVPILGAPGLRPGALAVWIEDDRPEAPVRAALAAGTRSPVALLTGPLLEALAQTRAERVLLVRAPDGLAPLAIERFGQAAALAPDAAVITCDEDELDSAAGRRAPRFRPGPSPDRWLACDDSGVSMVVARQRAVAVAGSLTGGPAWRHELALALAGSASEHAAHVPLILCHRSSRVPEPPMLDAATVAHRLERVDPGTRVELSGGVRRVRRPLGGPEPRVEVIVCLRDRAELLERCLGSLLEVTQYERLAVALVDNGSTEPETLALLRRRDSDPRVRVLRDSRPFNFAALNNAAVRTSKADVLVFLNNDTEIVDPLWIATLLEEALRPDVGAVAPLLMFPDATVQHAGVALGMHDYAGHPFAGLAPDRQTPFGRADGGTRNWLAVTAACMMVTRTKFAAVGGFDESFVVAGNDVDLCLRLTAAGYRSLCVPHAIVMHDESRTRGGHIDPGDFVASELSYGDFRTVGDPFYNPSLTLRRTDCGVRTPDPERG